MEFEETPDDSNLAPAHPGINPARRYETVGVSQSEAQQLFLAKVRDPIQSADPAPHNFGDDRGIYNLPGKWEGQRIWHASLDVEDEFGLETHPIAPGEVVFTGWTGMGNTIIIEHNIYGIKIYSVYGHFGRAQGDSSILVTNGDQVGYSSVIGITGITKPNSVIDPHLHFEARLAANIDLSNASNPLSGMRYWAFGNEDWREYFVDLGKKWDYDTDNFGNP